MGKKVDGSSGSVNVVDSGVPHAPWHGSFMEESVSAVTVSVCIGSETVRVEVEDVPFVVPVVCSVLPVPTASVETSGECEHSVV